MTPKHPRALTPPPEPNSTRREFQSVAMVIDASPKIHPENIMEIIENIVKLMSTCPKSPLFKFEMNGEAAELNFQVLRRFNFDLGKAIEAQARSPMGYGPECRKGEVLLPLSQHHPLWN
jgi:hypothetical protein